MVAMAKVSGRSSKARFAAYVEKLTEVIGHADRAGPLRDYCTGLLMPAERKSVEPMAAVTAPARVAAQHQSLLHFVANAPWSDEAMLAKVREIVLPEMTRTEPIAGWIIDDTSFPKKGRHSVGVGTGPRTRRGAPRQGCPRRSPSGPSPRSRSICSGRRRRPVCRAGSP